MANPKRDTRSTQVRGATSRALTPATTHRSNRGREGASGLPSLERLEELEVGVAVEWGTTQIPLQEARRLSVGDLLRLDQQAGDLVDILVNGKLFGRGRLVMVGDSYGVQLVELAGEGG